VNSTYYVAMLVVAIIVTLLYSLFPIYNKINPTLGGLPIFYWYQILLLAVTTILSAVVVHFVKEEGER